MQITSSSPQTPRPPLRVVREAQGLTLRQVADRAEMDPAQLSRVERGQGSLSIDALARLADVLSLRELGRLLSPYRKPGGRAP